MTLVFQKSQLKNPPANVIKKAVRYNVFFRRELRRSIEDLFENPPANNNSREKGTEPFLANKSTHKALAKMNNEENGNNVAVLSETMDNLIRQTENKAPKI